MHIAVLGSVSIKIPPEGQASVETLVYHQVIGLAKRGHAILLFAPNGSEIKNDSVEVIHIGEPIGYPTVSVHKNIISPEIYGAGYKMRLRMAMMANLMDMLVEKQDWYDVILNNMCEESPVLATNPQIKKPIYHILHVPILPQVADIYRRRKTKLLSISNTQRNAFPDLFYVATVYNGVDTNMFTYSPSPANYVLYLGSMGKNKNPKDAILAAKKAGVPILIGGKIKDQRYYDDELKHHIDGVQVQWIGEVSQKEVVKLYQKAKAYLFPTMWEEPFGLVAIESLSCGTPVIAYPHGGLLEIIKDGYNGYFVHTVEEMAEKILSIDTIDRKDCRRSVESAFSIEKMVEDYEKVLIQTA